MGCSESIVHFVPNNEISGQDHWSLNLMIDDVGFSENEIDQLYTQFLRMDIDKSDEIKAAEML